MKQLIYLFLLMPFLGLAQQQVTGTVIDENNQPILGANVYWKGTSIGVVTDEKGTFSIDYSTTNTTLVMSYVGYATIERKVDGPQTIKVQMTASDALNEVVVTTERQATEVSYIEQKQMVTINSKELLKAACCNLSESFETNPSVDVNFSDAVTGTKQIKMLGLTNPYILMTQENIPSVRGASQAYGLTFTPGTWLESIQITKGAGSVVNGLKV